MFIVSLLLHCMLCSPGQSLNYPAGASAIAAGYTGVVRKDLWAAFNNQAGTAYISKAGAGLFAENPFMVPGLNRSALVLLVPVKKTALNITFDQIGNKVYREIKTGLGCAMRLGEHFAAGLQLDYFYMTCGEGYGRHHSLSFEGGIIADITDKLSLAVHLFNPTRSKWSNGGEALPIVFRGGLSYRPEKSLLLFAEAGKSTTLSPTFGAGAEYQYKKVFFIRAGICSGPSRYCFGAGFRIKRLTIDLASSVHPWLGYSPHVSLEYSF